MNSSGDWATATGGHRANLIDLLHLAGLVRCSLHLLQRWQIVIISKALVIIIDGEAKFDHAVDAASELSGLIQVEARCQERGVEEQPDQILHCLVGLVCSCLLLKLNHNGMLWVHFHSLLRDHVGSHGVVTKGLSFHDAFHVGRPTVLGGGQHTRRVCHARADEDLLHLVAKHLLHEFGQWLKFRFQFLDLLLLILVIDVETLLGGALQLLAVELLQLLSRIFVNGVHHVQDFDALLAQCLQEWRGRDGSDTLAGDVEDVVLSFLHAIHVLLEADLLITRLGGVEAQELCNLGAVGGVFMHPELQALAECLVELLVIILLLCNLREHLQAFLDKVLLDHSQDLVLLQGLARDVQRKILRIHNALHKVQPFWHELLAVIHDEDAADIQLDVVPLLLGLEEIKGCPARDKKQGTELKLTLHAEMLHREVVLPVVGQGLVEARVLFICHVLRLAHPQRLVLVQLLPFVGHFLNFFGLLFLLLLLLLLINLFNFGLISFFLLLSLLTFILTVSDLLLLALLHIELNGEANEL
mmetsp:Transcript_36757/g.79203  ORF Transcript_36757/g.79203 Transcript_36757/m.79203 type:complete len:528 (+) Transcript_36757:116-1699(+)